MVSVFCRMHFRYFHRRDAENAEETFLGIKIPESSARGDHGCILRTMKLRGFRKEFPKRHPLRPENFGPHLFYV
jgi:hypothetical protein